MLFYHFTVFYWSTHTEICQNRSWWSKSKYYTYDRSVILVCPLRIQYHTGVVIIRWYCLIKFNFQFPIKSCFSRSRYDVTFTFDFWTSKLIKILKKAAGSLSGIALSGEQPPAARCAGAKICILNTSNSENSNDGVSV